MASTKVGNVLDALRRGVKADSDPKQNLEPVEMIEKNSVEPEKVDNNNVTAHVQPAPKNGRGHNKEDAKSKSKKLLSKSNGKAPLIIEDGNATQMVDPSTSASTSNTPDSQPTNTSMIQAQLDLLTKNMAAITPVVTYISQFIQDSINDDPNGQCESENDQDDEQEENKEDGEIVDNAPSCSNNEGNQAQVAGKLNLLDKLSRNMKSKENLARPVNASLAEIVNDLLSNGVSEDTVQEQKEKYCRPENCEFLKVPKVNEEIWQHALDAIRSKDLKLQNIQKNVLSSLTVIVQLMDKTMTAIDKNIAVSRTELLDGCSDAVSLLASASQEINVRRKELWRPELEESYKGLCTHNKPVTNWLFGDNLPQKVKEMSDTKNQFYYVYLI